jgi:uncharacterized membrane protein
MSADVDELLVRWTRADLIDQATADRIRSFEREHAGSGRLRWPVLIALAFGGLMIGAGVLLFVAAHWDTLAPHTRFALVLTLVAMFHAGGAAAADRFPALSSALHAIGTVALGAAIYLAGQIFNLAEHWPGGIMLWALGAAIGAVLLKQAPQIALLAILAPTWLATEWIVATGDLRALDSDRVIAAGVLLLALSYFTCWTGDTSDLRRRVLFWVGAAWLLPAAAFAAVVTADETTRSGVTHLTAGLRAIGWTIAIAVPTVLAFIWRGRDAWPNVAAVAWVIVLVNLHSIGGDIVMYPWWALGAIALVAWGVRDGRAEGINMGAAIFAGTVMAFYFSEVMDKLGRSASLMGMGLLFLAGGWALERLRRRLIRRVRGAA